MAGVKADDTTEGKRPNRMYDTHAPIWERPPTSNQSLWQCSTHKVGMYLYSAIELKLKKEKS